MPRVSHTGQPTRRVEIYHPGRTSGWLGGRKEWWWFDPDFPHAFEILDLDGFYEEHYFAADHVDLSTAEKYVELVIGYGTGVLGRPVESVLELGARGGWFSERFWARRLDLIAVEGTVVGHRQIVERGVPSTRVVRHDLRRPLDLGRTFDVVVCTEVAEHIEAPFSSQLVETIVRHGSACWFSFARPGENEAHYHHPNEQPEIFWRSLFAFLGWEMTSLPNEVATSVAGRGRFICHPRTVTPALPSTAVLGRSKQDRLRDRAARLGLRLVPPIVVGLARRRWRDSLGAD
jgi:hypothetical protein